MTTSALRFPAPPLDRAVDQLVVTGAGAISAGLDCLPATRTVWRLIILLSFGFFFELYDLRLTGYVAPGLVKVGIFTPTHNGPVQHNWPYELREIYHDLQLSRFEA